MVPMHPTDASVLRYGMGQNLGSFPYFPISAPSHLISPPFCSNCSSRKTTKKTQENCHKSQEISGFYMFSHNFATNLGNYMNHHKSPQLVSPPSKNHRPGTKSRPPFGWRLCRPRSVPTWRPWAVRTPPPARRGSGWWMNFFFVTSSTVTYSNYSNFIDYGEI